MGGSQTGAHADGPELYGTQAIWPADWRARWEQVRARTVGAFRAPARLRATPGRTRTLRATLSDAGLAGTLRRLSARHGVDEADVARLWSAVDEGDPRMAMRRVTERLRLVRSLESALESAASRERLRLRAATRDHVRTLAITAALALDGSSPAEAIQDFLEAALPKRIG